MWLWYAFTQHHSGSADLNRSDIRQASEQGEGVNDRSGTRWEESQRTINSCRNLPVSFFTSLNLWRSPLLKGRPRLESAARDAEPSQQAWPWGHWRNHPHRSLSMSNPALTRPHTHSNGPAWALFWLYLLPVTKTYESAPESSLNHG